MRDLRDLRDLLDLLDRRNTPPHAGYAAPGLADRVDSYASQRY